MNQPLNTPVLFCIYNRPEVTEQVFRVIARQRPRRLKIVADGANPNRPGDEQAVQATRKIVERVDWACELETDFAESNLGCRRRMSSGITNAFENVDRLIIIEDDCLPDDSFFGYCSQLLDRYRDNPEIMSISGTNFHGQRPGDDSYYFSRWPHIWGWATWKRAWQHYDVEMKQWPESRRTKDLHSNFEFEGESETFNALFDRQHAGEIDTWDFPWLFASWQQHGLAIHPAVNLVSNLGFGEEATHTTDADSSFARRSVSSLETIQHPSTIERHKEFDRWTWDNIFSSLRPAPPTPAKAPSRWKKWARHLGLTGRKSA